MWRAAVGMGLRGWLKRLERAADVVTLELLCPECGAEFTAKGEDPVLEFLATSGPRGIRGVRVRPTGRRPPMWWRSPTTSMTPR